MLILALIALVAFVVLLALGWYRGSSRAAVANRIERIRTSEDQTVEEELSKPFLQRVLLPLGEGVARMFRGYTPAEISDRTHRKLVMAGLFPRIWIDGGSEGSTLLSIRPKVVQQCSTGTSCIPCS